jgi:hypothetical protein
VFAADEYLQAGERISAAVYEFLVVDDGSPVRRFETLTRGGRHRGRRRRARR